VNIIGFFNKRKFLFVGEIRDLITIVQGIFSLKSLKLYHFKERFSPDLGEGG
jgi:hypothetical protein